MFFGDTLIICDIHGTLVGEDRVILQALGDEITQLSLERGARFGIASNAPLFGQRLWWNELAPEVDPLIYGLENGVRLYTPYPDLFNHSHQYAFFGNVHWSFMRLRKEYRAWRKLLEAWCAEQGMPFVPCYPDADAYTRTTMAYPDGTFVLFFDQHRDSSSMLEVRRINNGWVQQHACEETTAILEAIRGMERRHFPFAPEEDFLVRTFYGHHQIYPGKGPLMRWIRNHWSGPIFYIGDGTNCAPAMEVRGVTGVSVGPNETVRRRARIRIDTPGPVGAFKALRALQRIRRW